MQKVHLIDQSSKAQLSERKRKSSLKWAAINLCFVSVIFFDIFSVSKYSSESLLIYYIEYVSSGILLLSFATNILTFIYYSWFTDKIICDNEAQRILLNLSNNSVVRTPKPVHTPKPSKKETINVGNLSYQNYSERTLPVIRSVYEMFHSSLYSKFVVPPTQGCDVHDEPGWQLRRAQQLPDPAEVPVVRLHHGPQPHGPILEGRVAARERRGERHRSAEQHDRLHGHKLQLVLGQLSVRRDHRVAQDVLLPAVTAQQQAELTRRVLHQQRPGEQLGDHPQDVRQQAVQLHRQPENGARPSDHPEHVQTKFQFFLFLVDLKDDSGAAGDSD